VKTRLLVIGGFSAFDSLGTVVRALQRRTDLDVRYLATDALRYEVTATGKRDRLSPEASAEEVVKAASGWADVVLAWQIKKDLAPLGFEALKDKVRLVWWTIDDPYLLRTERSPFRDLADLVLSCSVEGVEYSQARGQSAALVWPAVDPDHHRFKADPALACDFAFCATNGYQRPVYPCVRAERREVARALRPLGSVALWGVWKDADLAGMVKGWRSYEELGPVFASAKFNLNNHVLPDAPGYLNQRVFEICGSGGFQLCDDAAGLVAAGFQSGEHLDTWHNLPELIEKVHFYNAHEEVRQRIARQGMEFAHSHHSADRWVDRFLGLLKGRVL
jgi:spore maturation protein CgeB